MNDIAKPTFEEVEQWGRTSGAVYPTENWDLILATDRYADLLLRLAADPSCIQRAAMLNFLYVYAAQVVLIGGHSTSEPALRPIIDRAQAVEMDEVRLWARRAETLLAGGGPDLRSIAPGQDHEFWYGWGWRIQGPSAECYEVIGSVELFEPRPVNAHRLPFRRLGRMKDGAGRFQLVELVDFGTWRERNAVDDTWTEELIYDYLKMRAKLAAPGAEPPLKVGEIIPEHEGDELPGGFYIPPRHLEVLPRIYAVERWTIGIRLQDLIAAHLPIAVARCLLVAVAELLRAFQRTVLNPAGITLEVIVALDGGLMLRPYLRFQPSADYLSDFSDMIDHAMNRRNGVVSLIGALADQVAEDAADRLWASSTKAGGTSLEPQEWGRLELPAVPALTERERAVLAQYVRECATASEIRGEADRILFAPPPARTVRRWETRPLPVLE